MIYNLVIIAVSSIKLLFKFKLMKELVVISHDLVNSLTAFFPVFSVFYFINYLLYIEFRGEFWILLFYD